MFILRSHSAFSSPSQNSVFPFPADNLGNEQNISTGGPEGGDFLSQCSITANSSLVWKHGRGNIILLVDQFCRMDMWILNGPAVMGMIGGVELGAGGRKRIRGVI